LPGGSKTFYIRYVQDPIDDEISLIGFFYAVIDPEKEKRPISTEKIFIFCN